MSQNTYPRTEMQNVTDLVADMSVGKKWPKADNFGTFDGGRVKADFNVFSKF